MAIKNKKRPVYLAFFCVLSAILFSGCTADNSSPANSSSKIRLLEFNGNTMGTTYSVKIVLANAETASESSAVQNTLAQNTLVKNTLAQEIDTALIEFNQVMSTYITDSELSRLNASGINEWFDISPQLEEVIAISETVFKQSAGAFDITIGPLVNLWGFGPAETLSVPSEEDLEEAKGKVGFDYVELAEHKIRKQKDVYLDLSAVAKGHATDVIARLLEQHNIENYMVEIGGELKIRGHNAKGRLWTIGIEKPTLGRSGAVQALSGDNIAIATSGDYRNYYEKDGVRISHTIDPVTGRPIDHTLVSVTVITAKGGFADAYATAINVLGPEKGRRMAENERLAVFLVIREGDSYRVEYTEQFKQYMVEI